MNLKYSNRRPSITLPSFCLVIGVVIALCPISAEAQGHLDTTECETIRDEVPRLLETTSTTGEGWEELAAQAKETLDCYRGRLEPDWAVWLLTNHVYALNRLQRYTEAQEVVDQFFGLYAQKADSADIAGFYMWDLRLKHFNGNFTEALDPYEKGLPYAHKLPDDYYKRYLLNAGSVHMAEGKFTEALKIYRDVRVTFSQLPADSSALELYGRTLLGETEASLDLILYAGDTTIDLAEVTERLVRAASILNLAKSRERSVAAHSALGLAYALAGNYETGAPYLRIAWNSTATLDLRRERILTLYRRAHARFLADRDDAPSDIETALMLSERYGIAEFETRLRYLQGLVLEEEGQPREALRAYEAAFNVAKESRFGRDAKIFRLASEGAFRVNKTIPTDHLLTYLFGFVIVVLLAYFVVTRPGWRREKRVPGTTEETEEKSFTPTVYPLNTFTRRYGYAVEVLRHPQGVAPEISNPILSGYLLGGGPAQVGELYETVAALEWARGNGKKVDGPAIKRMFDRHFRKRGWTVPDSVEAWRRHIEAHPLDSLANE